MIYVKGAAALILGGLAAAVVYWVIAVAALLGMHGIPLGSAGGPPTDADLAVHLAGAVIAGATAGYVAQRFAPARRLAHVLALAAGLAFLAFLGFSKPASQWPGWYPLAFALAVGMGTIAGGLLSSRKQPGAGVLPNA